LKRKKRDPPPLTPDTLAKAADAYLKRYPSSAENLRRVLRRRLIRRAHRGEDVPTQAKAWIDDLVHRLLATGKLNDSLYATALADSLARQGRSLRVIAEKLRQKGIPRDLVEATVAKIKGSDADLEVRLAHRYARRRRLGPYSRPGVDRVQRRQKDLAALARQGYSYAVAKAVIDGDIPQDDEDEVSPW
jgi:regulatory protein